jgi:hypothetical protein
MTISMFGCLDIWNRDLILELNAKYCLDGQSVALQLYETDHYTTSYVLKLYAMATTLF